MLQKTVVLFVLIHSVLTATSYLIYSQKNVNYKDQFFLGNVSANAQVNLDITVTKNFGEGNNNQVHAKILDSSTSVLSPLPGNFGLNLTMPTTGPPVMNFSGVLTNAG